MSENDFRGVGWRFPIVPQAGGGLGYVGLDDNVHQSVRLLLQTTAGERLMRPELGVSVPDLVFEADSDQHLFQLEQELLETVQRWEPRVEVDRLTAERVPGTDNTVEVKVYYRVRRTNSPRTLVFPFYLAAGEVVEQ
jgi:phage baseplate assembly protein W